MAGAGVDERLERRIAAIPIFSGEEQKWREWLYLYRTVVPLVTETLGPTSAWAVNQDERITREQLE